ncbi:MAG: hypothetical protein ACI4JJ_04140 [Huintestinicola sp.]
MSRGRSASWSRLDNAAKIFPSTVEKSDTRVFRFSCDLNEEVDPEILQRAAEEAVDCFPNFSVVMKKGLFWYYLEKCDMKIKVEPETEPVCSAIYEEDVKKLLFRVNYYHRRISLEVYHVLSDGTGALSLLKNIIYRYLIYAHPDKFAENPPMLDDDASISQKCDDSFRKYYDKDCKSSGDKAVRAFNLKGDIIENDRLHAIEGIASVKKTLELAHKYNTTLTVFVTALFIMALSKEMTVQSMKRPVTVNIPVNLRHYFPSETAKNFFGMISVSYNFSERSGELEDIISVVSEAFKEKLTREKLAVRMNAMASLEHNPFVKIAPLPFKNFVLKTARHIKDRRETAVISSIGKIKMPAEFDEYIDLFSMYVSTKKLQLGICSYGDKLTMGITTAFISTDIQRNFFRSLSEMGLDITIRCNDFYAEPEQKQENNTPDEECAPSDEIEKELGKR